MTSIVEYQAYVTCLNSEVDIVMTSDYSCYWQWTCLDLKHRIDIDRPLSASMAYVSLINHWWPL